MPNEVSSYLDPASSIRQLDIAPGQSVGDFGVGGTAVFAVELSRAVGTEGHVIMFDVNKAALSSALSVMKLKNIQNAQAVWSNLEIYGAATGIADGSLDAGTLINVLNQSTKVKDILAEAGRMLKSGGKLLVIDWKPDVQLAIAPPVNQRLSDGQIQQLGTSLGFAPLKTFEAGPYHWGTVLVKT